MRRAYVQKKLSFRHLCMTFDSKLPENYYSFPAEIIDGQIAIGKGFSAYMPVINCSLRFDGNNGLLIRKELFFLLRFLVEVLSFRQLQMIFPGCPYRVFPDHNPFV